MQSASGARFPCHYPADFARLENADNLDVHRCVRAEVVSWCDCSSIYARLPFHGLVTASLYVIIGALITQPSFRETVSAVYARIRQ